ncbi:MAG: hypothetical protein R3E97_16015 [Candidatus Eisenbacteria bacterium]
MSTVPIRSDAAHTNRRAVGPPRGPLIALLAWTLLCLAHEDAFPLPELWDSLCHSCHVDDSPTCVGCHNHRGELSARTTRAEYWPGETVEVRMEGGSKPGWTRARLYDEQGNLLSEATGPSRSGDDSLSVGATEKVEFPLLLLGHAPSTPGTYTWQASYFGIFHIQNVTHAEEWVPVDVEVVEPDLEGEYSWGRLKRHYR